MLGCCGWCEVTHLLLDIPHELISLRWSNTMHKVIQIAQKASMLPPKISFLSLQSVPCLIAFSLPLLSLLSLLSPSLTLLLSLCLSLLPLLLSAQQPPLSALS